MRVQLGAQPGPGSPAGSGRRSQPAPLRRLLSHAHLCPPPDTAWHISSGTQFQRGCLAALKSPGRPSESHLASRLGNTEARPGPRQRPLNRLGEAWAGRRPPTGRWLAITRPRPRGPGVVSLFDLGFKSCAGQRLVRPAQAWSRFAQWETSFAASVRKGRRPI